MKEVPIIDLVNMTNNKLQCVMNLYPSMITDFDICLLIQSMMTCAL